MSLKDVYQKHCAYCDKGTSHSYIDFYEKELSKYVGKKCEMLELGVQTGHSLLLWSEYFINGNIHGVDMLDCMKCIERHANINYYKFNLTDKDSVMRNLSGLRFDFIIDDASHILEEQVQSLKSLYAFLKNGGSYYIEDVQSFESCKSFEIEAKLLGCNVEIVDLRKIKNRYDDLICVFRKP